jgi:hypothetical protein
VLLATLAGALAAWFLIRRASRLRHVDAHALRARHAATLNLADDLAQWAESDAAPPGAALPERTSPDPAPPDAPPESASPDRAPPNSAQPEPQDGATPNA